MSHRAFLAATLLALAPSTADASGWNTGVWTYRAGWISLGAGALTMIGWGATTDWGRETGARQGGSGAMLGVGGALAAAGPIATGTGSLIARGAANRKSAQHLTAAPGTWGLVATGACYGGLALNLAVYEMPLPPVADCGFALGLPAWQMHLNRKVHGGRNDELPDDLGSRDPGDAPPVAATDPLDPPTPDRPAVMVAPVPWFGPERSVGVGLVGQF